MVREMQLMTEVIRLRKNKSSLELTFETALPFKSKKCPAESAALERG